MTKILVTFCGAGGGSMGYHRSGLDVTGVDIDPQPEYPFPFIQEDALKVLADSAFLSQFDLIHASPPCPSYCMLTQGTNGGKSNHPRLIDPVRALLEASGKPYVIENVGGSPVRKDLMLCGEMFSIGVVRHRYFELGNWKAAQPQHIKHRGRVRGWDHGKWYDGPYLAVYGHGDRGKGTVAEWQVAMDMPWVTKRQSIANAIPPAYTKYIGEQFLTQLP